MKRLLFIFILTALINDLPAQINKYGVPIVRNYLTEVTQGSDQNWCIAKDKLGNMYFGNQNRGVLQYNGSRWTALQIKTNPRIYSLASDDRGIVYVGAAYEFGYLQPDTRGDLEYISLAERIDTLSKVRVIWSVAVKDNKVYFQSETSIYIYDIKTDSLSFLALKKFKLTNALRIAAINDKLILTDNRRGFFELKDTTVTQLPGGEFFQYMPCTVLLPFNGTTILVCTYQDGLYLYDYATGDVNSRFIDNKLNDKLKELMVFSAAQISEDLFAIGATSQEGVLVFNRSGELVQQFKKDYSDLEDDAIYTMYCDYRHGSELWISVLGAISKIYINLPITQFGEQQGIDVGVNELCEFQDNIYVSSDAGIYKSYIDNQNVQKFKEITGMSNQYFPLEAFKSGSGDFLLSGGISGTIQIMKNDAAKSLEENCIGKPKDIPAFYSKRILQSRPDPDILFLGLESGGLDVLKYDRGKWYYKDRIRGVYGNVTGMVQTTDNAVWFSTDDPTSLNKITFSDKDTIVTNYGTEKGISASDIGSVILINDSLFIYSNDGMFRYDRSQDKFINDNTLTGGFSEGRSCQYLYVDKNGDTWYSGLDGKFYEMMFRKTSSGTESYRNALALLPNVAALDIMDKGGRIYITKSKQINVIDKSKLVPDTFKVKTLFTHIRVGKDSVVMTGTFHSHIDEKRSIPESGYPSASVPEYRFDLNDITFDWTTPYYIDEQQTTYSYKLEGFDKDWSDWERMSYKEYTNLSFGHYTFRVKARTALETEMDEAVYGFIILKPWYLRIYMIFAYIIAAMLMIWGIIAAYTRRLKNENIRLEGIVRERTATVVKQKEELESSIYYARRIQMALLPSESILQDNIRNYFILFKPRDIVSGDFYWMTKKDDRLYIVAADCTGHGVPGAFMSLLGMSFLDEILDHDSAARSNTVLNQLRLHVTESLKQSGGEDEAKDGMDMGMLVIDYKTKMIEFSGAYNPCFRVRKLSADKAGSGGYDSEEMPDGSMSNGKYLLETIYANKMPIGISSRMNEEFKLNEWPMEKGVSYYLFSDGYIDQFGGEHGRKFMKKNFKRLILDLQDLPMTEQRERFDKNLTDWRGSAPQIDDILVMGIRID